MVNTCEMSVVTCYSTFIGALGQLALESLQNRLCGRAVQISSSQVSVDPVSGTCIVDISVDVINEAIACYLVKVKIQTHVGDFTQGAVVKESGTLGLGFHLWIQLYNNGIMVAKGGPRPDQSSVVPYQMMLNCLPLYALNRCTYR